MKGCTSSLSGYRGCSGEGRSGGWGGGRGRGPASAGGQGNPVWERAGAREKERWGGQITFPIASGLWNFLWGVGAEAGEDGVGLRLAGDEEQPRGCRWPVFPSREVAAGREVGAGAARSASAPAAVPLGGHVWVCLCPPSVVCGPAVRPGGGEEWEGNGGRREKRAAGAPCCSVSLCAARPGPGRALCCGEATCSTPHSVPALLAQDLSSQEMHLFKKSSPAGGLLCWL